MSKLEMGSKTFGILGLIGQLKSGQINRDAEMQRSYVWGNKEQTEYLDSLFQSDNTYIPPIIGAETDTEIEVKGKTEKVCDLLDGKQRTTTLELFLDNKIKLGNNILPVVIEQEDGTDKEYKIAGLSWEEIPEEVKTNFKANKITMVYFKNMDYAARERQFIKLQGGKKLSNAEVNKVRIGQDMREFIYKQLASELWAKYIKISDNRETRFETMQQIIMILNNNFNLTGKSLQEFAEGTTPTQESLEQVEAITEYLNEVAKTIKKNSLPAEIQELEEAELLERLEGKELKRYLKPIEYLKKLHVPIIYTVTGQAIQNGIQEKHFAVFVEHFFEKVSFEYSGWTGDKTAEAKSVKGRIEALEKDFTEYFKIEKEDQPEQSEEQEDGQEVAK